MGSWIVKVNEYSQQKLNLKPIVCGTIGNLVEWYDWFTYTAVNPVAKAELFPTEIRALGVSFVKLD